MDTLDKKKLWQWVFDIVVWVACVYALTLVIKYTCGKLDWVDQSMWPEWVSKHSWLVK